MSDGLVLAYRKIARAYKRGTGCRLTAYEIACLATLDNAIEQVVEQINSEAVHGR